MSDLVQRLRAIAPESGWAVVNTKTDGIVIWFSHRHDFSAERKARDWLKEHAGTHRNHEVRPYEDACLDHEAADELERLTRELEEARKDAERYRWARSLEHCNKVWCFIGAGEAAGNLDAAIDAAMSQEKRKDALDRMARDADELGLDY